ncbi:MAG: formate dehydrogenase accessory protein FdhE [Hydrogenophaga sp.]|nr:formate dehydrogenase accessory protein FdhE [Gammaproteobacteria bacterium]
MTATLQSNEFQPVARDLPRVILPDTDIFARRAQRFARLAEGHALGDWLNFLSRLSRAQHAALQTFPALALPSPGQLQQASANGMPPLPAAGWMRDPAWRTTVLPSLLEAAEDCVPEAGRRALAALRLCSADELEALADEVLSGRHTPAHAATLPIVGAALQVYWTHMAAAMEDTAVPPLDVPGVCPCCGSLPVASVQRTGGEVDGLRYLHCSLCNTQWNLVRVKCAVCDTTEGIAYQAIEGHASHVRAETCDGCKSYLKIIHTEKDPQADPVADDLATLALDLLLDEAGYTRAAPNLLLVTGDAS